MKNEETKNERGCMLMGALVLSLLGALFYAVLYGASFAIIVTIPRELNQYEIMECWLSLVCFLANACAIIFVYYTFKMQKKGAYRLIGMAVITVVGLTLDGFLTIPDLTHGAKDVVDRFLIISLIGCIFCSIVIAFHIKRMK